MLMSYKLKKYNHKKPVYLVIKEEVIVSGGGEESDGDNDRGEENDGGGDWNSWIILYIDYYL